MSGRRGTDGLLLAQSAPEAFSEHRSMCVNSIPGAAPTPARPQSVAASSARFLRQPASPPCWRWPLPHHGHLTRGTTSHTTPSCTVAHGSDWPVTGYKPEVLWLGREERSPGDNQAWLPWLFSRSWEKNQTRSDHTSAGSREHRGPQASMPSAQPRTHQGRAGEGTDASSNPGSEPVSHKHPHPPSQGQGRGPQWHKLFGNRGLPNPVN